MKAPVDPWLTPDPYRILYQLAAQHLNAAQVASTHEAREAEAEAHLAGARRTAALLLGRARRLAEHAARRRGSGVLAWFRRRWRSRELRQLKRMEAFLAETLVPCADLIARSVDLLAGERITPPVPRGPLGPRAHYNVACMAARLPADDRAFRELAFEHLQQALAGTSGRARADLGRWLQRDPALRPLLKRDPMRTKGLLDAFAVPLLEEDEDEFARPRQRRPRPRLG